MLFYWETPAHICGNFPFKVPFLHLTEKSEYFFSIFGRNSLKGLSLPLKMRPTPLFPDKVGQGQSDKGQGRCIQSILSSFDCTPRCFNVTFVYS